MDDGIRSCRPCRSVLVAARRIGPDAAACRADGRAVDWARRGLKPEGHTAASNGVRAACRSAMYLSATLAFTLARSQTKRKSQSTPRRGRTRCPPARPPRNPSPAYTNDRSSTQRRCRRRRSLPRLDAGVLHVTVRPAACFPPHATSPTRPRGKVFLIMVLPSIRGALARSLRYARDVYFTRLVVRVS